jgi:predicted amidohydrolase/regulation of enolase protein 1 (concanavalin A-like superfamily)
MSRPLSVVLAIVILNLAPGASTDAQELMPSTPAAWTGFSARPESAPGLLASGGEGSYALEVYGNGVPSVYGGWRTRIEGLTGGQQYRFRARALAVDMPSVRESVTILLRWRGSFGDRVAPDYVWQYAPQPDGTVSFDRVLAAPGGTTSVDIQLVLQWAPNGRVRFDALSFTASAAPAPRPVTLAAVSYRPSGTSSGLESVRRAADWGAQVASMHGPDVMVFGELLNVIGAPGTYDDKAETVPGPSTDLMAELARTHAVHVAFGLLERDGSLLYNTAVLLDRAGAIVGKYRKMQLALPEAAAGATPGDRVPVFQTDIGRVALLICQDTFFPEPAREAAIQGAELLLVPIWGGKTEFLTARAVEQSMYVVASGYDYFSEVRDPLGTVLDRVETLSQADAAVATVDLSQRFREDWSGDWRDVSNKERRLAASPYTAGTTAPDGGLPPPPPPENLPPSVSITAPSDGETFAAPATFTIAAAASDADGTISRVEFYAGTTLLGSDATDPHAFTWSGVAAGTYTLTARALDDGGAAMTSSPVTITVASPPPTGGLPAPWQTGDIGAVGVTGTAHAGDGTFPVEGAGADIWGTADAFRFVWQPITGDVDIVARVASIEWVHEWTKGGVMIREQLTAGSPHAFMLVSPGKGLAFQRRRTAGSLSIHTSGGAGTAPAWVGLQRRGSTITAYASTDGVAWTLVGSESFSMAASVYVGLAVTSHDTSQLATVTLDNVTVTTGLPVPWQGQDVGAVGVAGSAEASGGTFTIHASGVDVWGTADSFHYVWQHWQGDGEVIARVTSLEHVHAWTKAGVMIREQLTADSPHAFMLVSTAKGLAFQRRVATAGISTNTSGGAVAAPVWVKLERRGTVISGYWSADGASWAFVGSDTFTMGGDVYVGLAVTSHDNTRLAMATLDGVVVR